MAVGEPPAWVVWLQSEPNQIIPDTKTASRPFDTAQLPAIESPRLKSCAPKGMPFHRVTPLNVATSSVLHLQFFSLYCSSVNSFLWWNCRQGDAINGLRQSQQASAGSVLLNYFPDTVTAPHGSPVYQSFPGNQRLRNISDSKKKKTKTRQVYLRVMC